MSWIKDVTNEIKALDVSAKSLRKFGLVVGGVFLIAALFLFWKDLWSITRVIFLSIGVLLIFGGIARKKGAEFIFIYKIWMGLAFALGWIVSRFILLILFYIVLFPIGLLAKLFKKEFLDLKFRDGRESYWIPKEKKLIDYEKMY